MDFVSKQQTYEATRKLLLATAASTHDAEMDDLVRDMQMEGDHSRNPDLYQHFLDALRSDPLEPQTALEAAAQFMRENVDASANPEVARLIDAAEKTAEDPEKGDPSLWNRWIELLASV